MDTCCALKEHILLSTHMLYLSIKLINIILYKISTTYLFQNHVAVSGKSLVFCALIKL